MYDIIILIRIYCCPIDCYISITIYYKFSYKIKTLYLYQLLCFTALESFTIIKFIIVFKSLFSALSKNEIAINFY